MNILFLASNFPDPVNETWAPWNKRAVDAVLEYANPVVIAPRPFAPPFSKFFKIPNKGTSYGYPVYYPRFVYLLPKRIFYCITGKSYEYFVGRFIKKKVGSGQIEKPDIIHALHPYLDGYGGVSIAKDLSVPLVVTVHSPNNLKACPKRVLSVLQNADKVITVAEFLRTKLIDIGILEEKVEYVSLGVDTRRFRPLDRSDSMEILRKYDIDEEDVVILYVGRLSAEKNLESLVKSVPIILNNAPSEIRRHIKFVIVGKGPEEKNLRKIVSGLGVGDHVLFVGGLNHNSMELNVWYGIADIFVLPSLSEGKPVAVYEAMSSGCAIVASGINGILEQVFEGVNGFLIPPGDVDTLVTKILYLLDNPKELDRMKKASRELIFKLGYTWDKYRESIKRIYENLGG